MRDDSIELKSFMEAVFVSPPTRVQGTAVFLVSEHGITPNALLHNLKHNKVLHERVLFVTVSNLDVPEVAAEKRSTVETLASGIFRITIRYGFTESPNIPRALEELRTSGLDYDPMQASFFLGREVLVRAMVPKLPKWRLFLFLLLARNAVPATEFFRIPSDRVVELGVRVAI